MQEGRGGEGGAQEGGQRASEHPGVRIKAAQRGKRSSAHAFRSTGETGLEPEGNGGECTVGSGNREGVSMLGGKDRRSVLWP